MRRPQSRRGGAGESMRDQGNASLLVEAGQARSMEIGRRVKLGLPWGPKARLVLMHLKSAATCSGKKSGSTQK
jgi:hypothetical protein